MHWKTFMLPTQRNISWMYWMWSVNLGRFFLMRPNNSHRPCIDPLPLPIMPVTKLMVQSLIQKHLLDYPMARLKSETMMLWWTQFQSLLSFCINMASVCMVLLILNLECQKLFSKKLQNNRGLSQTPTYSSNHCIHRFVMRNLNSLSKTKMQLTVWNHASNYVVAIARRILTNQNIWQTVSKCWRQLPGCCVKARRESGAYVSFGTIMPSTCSDIAYTNGALCTFGKSSVI